MTSFGFSEADTELVVVVGVALQLVDTVAPESNAVVLVVAAVVVVTAVVVVVDLAGSGWYTLALDQVAFLPPRFAGGGEESLSP